MDLATPRRTSCSSTRAAQSSKSRSVPSSCFKNSERFGRFGVEHTSKIVHVERRLLKVLTVCSKLFQLQMLLLKSTAHNPCLFVHNHLDAQDPFHPLPSSQSWLKTKNITPDWALLKSLRAPQFRAAACIKMILWPITCFFASWCALKHPLYN